MAMRHQMDEAANRDLDAVTSWRRARAWQEAADPYGYCLDLLDLSPGEDGEAYCEELVEVLERRFRALLAAPGESGPLRLYAAIDAAGADGVVTACRRACARQAAEAGDLILRELIGYEDYTSPAACDGCGRSLAS